MFMPAGRPVISFPVKTESTFDDEREAMTNFTATIKKIKNTSMNIMVRHNITSLAILRHTGRDNDK